MKKLFILIMLTMLTITASAQSAFFEGGLGAAIPTNNNNYFNTFFNTQITVGMPVSSKVLMGVEYTNLSYWGDEYDYTVQTLGIKFYAPFVVRQQYDVSLVAGLGYGWDTLREYDYTYDHLNFFVPKVGLEMMFNVLPERRLQIGFGGEYSHYILTESDTGWDSFGAFNLLGKLRVMF